jgi:MFS family permease
MRLSPAAALFSGAAQMQQFGWRIPFLLSIVSASAAVALRMHMPEPEEFTRQRKEVIQHNLQRIASRRASSLVSRSSSTGSAGAPAAAAGGLAGSFKSLGLKTVDSLTLNRQQKLKQQQQQQQVLSPQGSETAGVPDVQLQKLYSLSEDAPTTAAAEAGPAAVNLNHPTSNGDASIAIEGAAGVPEKQGEYVPAVRLLRKHWLGVLLQFLFEAWVSIGFWVISTWLPLQLRKAPVFMPEKLTQAMLIVNLSAMGLVQLAAGWASDKGMPRVWSCFAVFTLAAGISVPVFIGFARASAAGCWLLHLLLMVLMGWVLGVVPGAKHPFVE